MPDQHSPPSANNRFKAEMPHIPGVSTTKAKASGIGRRWLVAGGLIVLILAIVVVVAARVLSKASRSESTPQTVPQIDVPGPVPDLTASVPVAAEPDPAIATVGDLAKPWSSRTFVFHNRTTGEAVPALLIRIPAGSPSQASGYWSFAMKSIYGNCKLEYVEDLQKLGTDYGYPHATHPLVANPCTRSLYDPLKYAALPDDILVRGAIVQGSDLRPPLSIEINLKGKEILATRME